MAYFEDGKCEDARLQELLIMPIESYVKDCPDRVWICKKSMRLRQDPPLDIQVLTVLQNYEKNIKKCKFEKTPKMMKNHFRSALALPTWNKKLLRICIPLKIQIRNCWQNLTTFQPEKILILFQLAFANMAASPPLNLNY